MQTLVVGMGNPILRDDAVGIRLARDLRTSRDWPVEVQFQEECSVGGLNLLEVLAGWDRIVILDAIQTKGGVPGHWYRFTAAALRPTQHLSNVHDVNFSTALELGRRMGTKLPSEQEIHIFAVEVKDPFTFDERMSTELETAYARFAGEIFDGIGALLRVVPLPA